MKRLSCLVSSVGQSVRLLIARPLVRLQYRARTPCMALKGILFLFLTLSLFTSNTHTLCARHHFKLFFLPSCPSGLRGSVQARLCSHAPVQIRQMALLSTSSGWRLIERTCKFDSCRRFFTAYTTHSYDIRQGRRKAQPLISIVQCVK